ncbi:putative F-box domain, leucine-rich repeat domain superfamily [Helianthus annuus]|uniref:F-box domain, leucine-rich repeat domain superfamily n=2 Tax=Helianthus annuus TaxID=4232 RepID=A0A251TWQ5_HELAN|nr:F-box/LRR-repeat protein 15 isoform X2 [Helianthus annuus]KAF5802605.1 putative F-box domain, leucine-rich repeat domain superfamily [Helianthus annuus]KAJ0560708.1 putative F-box/LRR-repeat protein [Helianthus annuus]KAJ0567097.1 putative F-box domain, leucine-rich repeat domain superfamily [Helianthus annuus]KAJ0573744.1 putative F-box/LRR-repeat protein [Helianthus annuus]KAJ0738080.1 putative F-box/LRR-repeat protein [Helianthus annuus]
MRIWCLLCFGEEEHKIIDTMSEKSEEIGHFEELGFESLVNSRNEDDLRSKSTTEDVNLNLNLSLGGESSGSSGAVERGGLDRDSHSKRHKAQSTALDSGSFIQAATLQGSMSFSLIDTEYERTHDSSGNYGCLLSDDDRSPMEEDMDDREIRMDLTDDLLHMVFSFLDQISLCGAAKVCRQWRAASAHEDFWRVLNFENRNISPQQFEDMCHRYPNATQVNINGSPAIHTLVMQTISSLRNLESLTLGKGQLGETFFQALTDCTMLKSLIVTDAMLGNGIQEIPIHHDSLRHIQIVKCRVVRISVRCPQLQTLSLKRSSMAHAVLNCPLLRDLDIGSCHKLLDAAIRSAVTSCPLLESLDVSNCSCVSDETLREISISCTNLHVLNASYCPNISLESVRLTMLTVLKLHSCEGITSASMAAISHSYMLEVLELDNCSLLTSVFLDLPRLQHIRLVHCRKFVDLSLRSAVLSSIKVSNCPALQRINIVSNSLQKLVLHKQDSLTSLELQCQGLEEVDLTDCESLTNSICDVFSDGSGCPMLKSLILDNCESLTAVKFSSNSLTSLSLAGCRAITSIELTCPYLEQVSLAGCDHLERAIFSPVGLRSLNLGICPKLNALKIEAPSMVLLELKGCGVISEAFINCPLLTSLDASFCSQLKDNCLSATTASCPLIESLILMSCSSIGSDGLLSLRRLKNLTSLDLSYTFLTNLQPVFASCPQLKILKLQACKYLTDTSLEPLYKDAALPTLRELDLSYGTLCQASIEELLACCTHLTHVSLNGCVNMHDLNWSFSADWAYLSSMGSNQPQRFLQNLNCVGCPNIKKVLISSVARFSNLSSLNISLSAYLKEVDVACINLCFLNLSNCSSLEILKLDCPRLTSLFLQSCNISEEAVESAISECNMLETLDVRFCQKIISTGMGRLRTACPSLKRIFS